MKAPFLTKINRTFIFIFLCILALVYGKPFFMPVAFAALFALLILPLCKKLEAWGLKRNYASLLSIIILIIPLMILIGLSVYQLTELATSFAFFKDQAISTLDTFQNFVQKLLGISVQKQIDHIKLQFSSFMHIAEISLKGIFITVLKIVAVTLLTIVYTFFFLYYREKFKIFLLQVTRKQEHTDVKEVIAQIRNMVSHYLRGIFTVVFILSVLNTLGLSLIGVKYALLLGPLAAFLNIIPYIGTAIGSTIPLIVNLLNDGSWQSMLAIIVLFVLVQLLDSHILTPTIIGPQVRVNPLAVITVAVLGGLLWGVSGIILFIPLLGIIKIILEHIPTLQPYAYLISNKK